MTSVFDNVEAIEEIVVFLKNSDIYTTTERGVTTDSDTGTFSADSTHLIAVSNVKNIRSITVASSPLTFGTDYTVDYSYDDSGTIKCQISFTSPQTGAYTISYDYGTDIIRSGSPRTDLTIGSFPRVGVYEIGDNNEDIDLPGSTEQLVQTFAIAVYDVKVRNIDSKLGTIKEKMIANKADFFHHTYVKKLNKGPLLPFAGGRGKVQFKTMNYISNFNIETV